MKRRNQLPPGEWTRWFVVGLILLGIWALFHTGHGWIGTWPDYGW